MGKHKDKQIMNSPIKFINLESDDSIGSSPQSAFKSQSGSSSHDRHRHHRHRRHRGSRSKIEVEDDDVFRLIEPPSAAGYNYYKLSIHCLSSDFPRASMSCVKRALKCHLKRLGPAYEALHREYQLALLREEGKEIPQIQIASWLPPEGFILNRHPRAPSQPSETCPVFDRELAAVKRRFGALSSAAPSAAAAICQDIECGCCFLECAFTDLVQCADGHLFCFSCLRRHVEEAVFGGAQGRSSLPCLDTAGCEEHFPWSEVSRALPPDVLAKYEKRLAEDSVARAGLEGLVYCPFCDFPCELDPGFRVLDCPNKSCKKSSCLQCKEPVHFPLECDQVENRSETSLRRHVEELMTKALIRQCTACKAELVKVDGCNKVTCRCGQLMCYVCRKAIFGYNHFCQHPLEPGKACSRCTGCGLWEQEASEAVVQAAKEAALKEVAEQEPSIANKRIGPQEEEQNDEALRPRTRRRIGVPVQARI